MPEDTFRLLDTFEGHSLRRADGVYAREEWRQAAAEYEAFLLEFPRSAAVSYALYRRGRSLQLDNKRFEAIRLFRELLDFFPDDVPFAAAALFQIGQSHWDNGRTTEALRAWAELADDKEYRLVPLAAGAINRLADNFLEQGRAVDAVRHYEHVAVAFRRTSGDQARHALGRVLYHYIRRLPNHPALYAFYEEVLGFEHHPREPDERNYWWRVVENVRRHASFPDDQKEARDAYFRYWAQQMDGRFPGWDDFQIARAEFLRNLEADTERWYERLDAQFTAHQEEGNYARIVKWIQLYAGHAEKVEAYYRKLDFARMGYDQIQSLMRVSFDHLRDNDLARNVFRQIPLGSISDDQRYHLARYLWHRHQTDMIEAVCASMQDTVRGQMELLRYYHWRTWHHHRRYAEQALELAAERIKDPATAGEAYWMMAEIHHRLNQWEQAIAAYRVSEREPQSLWRIVDGYLALGQREQALGQLREIENFFASDASRAALRTAHIQRDAGETASYVAALRAVLNRYPDSRESSTAHLELEQMGITRIGGGLDAE